MITLNGTEFKTLDDKFYIGDRQVGKVYLGDTLIYPKVQNQVIVDNVEVRLLPMSRNNNVYDTGYAPNKNTCFEVAFSYNSDNGYIDEGFFGTHHDNGSTKKDLPEDTVNSTYAWKTNTTMHFIIYPSGTGNSSMRFRYGGPSIETAGYTPSVYDKEITTANGIDLSRVDSDYNEKVFFFTLRRNIWGWGYGVGPYLKGDNATYSASYNVYESNTASSSDNSIARSYYSSTQSGGNIWLGAINRNYSSTSSSVNPNIIRNHFPFSEGVNKTSIETSCSDLNVSKWGKSNTSFIYVLIWDEDSSGNITNKCLYTPHRSNIIDPNSTAVSGDELYYVAYHKQSWDNSSGKFLPPDTIIFPFMHVS